MRCKNCNKALSDTEATVKDKRTGKFLDTCSECNGVTYSQQYEFDLKYVYDKPNLGVDKAD